MILLKSISERTIKTCFVISSISCEESSRYFVTNLCLCVATNSRAREKKTEHTVHMKTLDHSLGFPA